MFKLKNQKRKVYCHLRAEPIESFSSVSPNLAAYQNCLAGWGGRLIKIQPQASHLEIFSGDVGWSWPSGFLELPTYFLGTASLENQLLVDWDQKSLKHRSVVKHCNRQLRLTAIISSIKWRKKYHSCKSLTRTPQDNVTLSTDTNRKLMLNKGLHPFLFFLKMSIYYWHWDILPVL